jgi:predicted O-methyltransferase YrrM
VPYSRDRKNKELAIKSLARQLSARIGNFQFSLKISNLLVPHLRKESFLDQWVVRPMNGQKNRLKTTFLLSEILNPAYVIESGSFLGTTSQYLTSMASKKTFSVEINQEFATIANRRLSSEIFNNELEIIDGNSAVQIPLILNDIEAKTYTILAYLDAHWLDDIPLRDELQSLLTWGGQFIAVIDDFYIPDDLGYGFDQYENHRVDISHIPNSEELSVWVPSQNSSKESGARRGTAYVVSSQLEPKIVENASKLNLRPYPKQLS